MRLTFKLQYFHALALGIVTHKMHAFIFKVRHEFGIDLVAMPVSLVDAVSAAVELTDHGGVGLELRASLTQTHRATHLARVVLRHLYHLQVNTQG